MKKGFTLIELIVVVMILLILATLAMPQFFKVAEKARAGEGVNLLGALRSSMLRYFTEYGNTSDNITNYDVELNSKYFNVNNTQIIGGIGNWTSDEEIANITRNDVKRPGNVAEYTLHIDTDGDIWCTSTDGDYSCKKMGFPINGTQ